MFILAIFEETDRSMVRSPISTTRPPRISGLTLVTTLSFWPWPTYCDLETADSRREMVLLSRGCADCQYFLSLSVALGPGLELDVQRQR